MSTEPMTQDASEEQDPSEHSAVPGPEQDSGAESPEESAAEGTSLDADSTEAVGTPSAPVGKPNAGTSRREDLEHEGEVAADFLESLLDIADLDGDLEVNVEGDRAAVAIVDSEEGHAPKRLVGPGGEVLEALQELTRLAVQAETGDRSRLMLDVAGHRAGRRTELVKLARTTCEHVKKTGERAELDPMSAFERKVVHDEVVVGGLVSESEGVEPQRYVVILPQG